MEGDAVMYNQEALREGTAPLVQQLSTQMQSVLGSMPAEASDDDGDGWSEQGGGSDSDSDLYEAPHQDPLA